MRSLLALLLFDFGCWLERMGMPPASRDLCRQRQRSERHYLKRALRKDTHGG